MSALTIKSRPGLFKIHRANGAKCVRDAFGFTSFELYSPFPHLPFTFLPRCQIPVDSCAQFRSIDAGELPFVSCVMRTNNPQQYSAPAQRANRVPLRALGRRPTSGRFAGGFVSTFKLAKRSCRKGSSSGGLVIVPA